VFSFLPRVHLAQLVPHIGDRQFVKFINFSLHECGEVTLGRIRIKLPSNGNDDPAIVQTFRELPLGDVPMPDNIKDFTEIRLRFLFSNLANLVYIWVKKWIGPIPRQ
jgi:hypothetical protein